MAIPEALVASVVTETSERMKDPAYAQLAVGAFVEEQKHLSQYLSSRSARLGGAQGVLTLIFHAQILCDCLHRALGADVPMVGFPTLDRAAQGDPAKVLAEREPALASYISSNVDEAPLRSELSKVALALVLAGEGGSRGAGPRGR
jgi:hypothetical protein